MQLSQRPQQGKNRFNMIKYEAAMTEKAPVY